MSDWQSTNEARLAAPANATSVRLTEELDQLREQHNAVLLERDQLLDHLTNQSFDLAAALNAINRLTRELADARADVERVIGQRDAATNQWADARIEVENLRTELAESRNWIVARDGGRTCERCEGEVRRGEAYEIQDSTDGLLLHIECPDRPRHARTWQLTDKGLAAVAGPEPTEGEPPA